MKSVLGKILRAGEGKKLKELQSLVNRVNGFEAEVSKLRDEELRRKTAEFKKRIDNGEDLVHIIPESYAVVREVGKRTLDMRHFDVQIMGGLVLHQGKIAEMKTGEGKTLVATLPVYLNALIGKGVHVVTVNDYLAKRDAEWMGNIYRFLGLSVGLIQAQMSYDERKNAYKADVTYGTNNEMGFDYLRDNMVNYIENKVQRGHNFAIVDEVDSILIDEARTPLIISGPAEKAADIYYKFAKIVPRLKEGTDFEVDEKAHTVAITEEGVAKVEKSLNIDNLYDHVNSQLVNHLNQALRANNLYKKDVDYVIKDGEVIIVDEFTGRLQFGKRYSEGLHQAIEAKEGVSIREESQTLATITLQNYFRMYDKLAGMTGTAATEADEFMHIYKLETVIIPTNKELIRKALPDIVYKSEEAKFSAVVDDIYNRYQVGQPVLVGTVSIDNSEKISSLLKKKGVPHNVLNAKHHESEAEIVAQAGKYSNVTIATNMAGRGTDIVLGGNPPDKKESKKVIETNGLHVLGTERHEARRIDNQLRGRSGRQGDPGSSQFYLSLEDDLMRLFGGDRLKGVMERINFPEDQPIENRMVTKTIETAQKQVEAQNFNIRKNLLEYDDVMNKQREVIYEQRDLVLKGKDLKEQVKNMISYVVENVVSTYTNPNVFPEEWDLDGLFIYLNQIIPLELDKKMFDLKKISVEELKDMIIERSLKFYQEREEQFGSEQMREMERIILLQVIDNKWKEHLLEMDYLKEGIHLRAYAQTDPLVAYKNEAFEAFQNLNYSIKEDYIRYLNHARIIEEIEEEQVEELQYAAGGESGRSPVRQRKSTKVGRNAPCPCGSGKKYKKCCGK